ncbi:UDP-glycosyltransferase 84B2-like [Cornus florida]|uniref:UDP-glycosyltransferase 84B2-like n=1 Tax=Cornus florida TaxID=4283 RepID=UPI002896AA7A|nr:UDP-glycosyltransferase 84B2-like [Cornus florida]
MVTLPFQGHINPMLRFAKRLVSKGLHVTLATTEVARQTFSNGQSTTMIDTNQNGVAQGPKIQLEFFSDDLDLDLDRNKHLDLMLQSLPLSGSKNLSNLITNLGSKGQTFSCIIHQIFVPWVADVAADRGIPCAMLCIQGSSLFSIYHRYNNEFETFPSFDNPNSALELPGLPLLEVKDLPTFILPSSPPHFKKLLSESIQSLEKVNWVLVNSFYELEADAVKSMALFKPVLPIGPLVPSPLIGKEEGVTDSLDMWNSDDSCLEWLDKKPPSSVVYLAFGSITVLAKKQIENIAMALRESKRPFLWVVKSLGKDGENKDGLPLEFLEETNGTGLVVSWCNQAKVLMHPALACFVSHCGWNSILEAVAAGVPVIAFPEWTDQPTNAKLVVDAFKTGVRMRTEEDRVVTKEEVVRCIFEVTEGPRAREIKERAAELKEAARKAVGDGGSSDRNVDYFISQFTEQPSQNTITSDK